MAVSRVAGSHAEVQYAASSSSRTLVYGGALTAGSLLVVTICTTTTTGSLSCVDSVNGAYTLAVRKLVGIRSVEHFYFYNNGSTGTPTVTVVPSDASFMSITVDEYLGVVNDSDPFRASASNNGTSATLTTASVTALATDLIVAGGMEYSGTAVVNTVTAPFVGLTNLPRIAGATTAIFTAYDLAAPGSEGCTFNLSASGSWIGAAASFRAVPAALPPMLTGFVTDGVPRRSRSVVAY
jgi:hypothetical protein